MYGIFNKCQKYMAQFGTFEFDADAYNVLRKAVEKMPADGLHIKPIEKDHE